MRLGSVDGLVVLRVIIINIVGQGLKTKCKASTRGFEHTGFWHMF